MERVPRGGQVSETTTPTQTTNQNSTTQAQLRTQQAIRTQTQHTSKHTRAKGRGCNTNQYKRYISFGFGFKHRFVSIYHLYNTLLRR